MRIEIHLKRILQKHKLTKPGIAQDIADGVRVHRHTIGKLIRNKMKHPSLDVLGDVCEWLISKGVPATDLAQELFFIRPSEFWEAVAKPGKVCLYLGDHPREESQATVDRDWISRRDGLLAINITQRLSRQTSNSEASGGRGARLATSVDSRPELEFEFVNSPHTYFRSKTSEEQKLRKLFTEAKARFAKLRDRPSPPTSILIGSQRTNILTECCVADAFDCKPFVAMHEQKTFLPFYLTYRPNDVPLPSCFGGPGHPAGVHAKASAKPGIWYWKGGRVTDPNSWHHCPCEQRKSDGGIVFIVRDQASKVMDVAIFGFSGEGTAAIGARLLQSPERFWPATEERPAYKKRRTRSPNQTRNRMKSNRKRTKAVSNGTGR